MGVGEDFREFVGNLSVTNRDSIAHRYARITKRLNLDFWASDSDTYHSFYTGSYGRGTAVGFTSDVDMLFRLPYEEYQRYDGYQTNGQAALLRAVKSSIESTYAITRIGSDGSVVVVPFDDGMTFEVLPAVLNADNSYTFPDSTGGGAWKTTNPKPEIDAISTRDSQANGNLKNLCKMARAWKANWGVPISGLLIDTLAYNFVGGWQYRDKSYLYYDYMSRDFFELLAASDEAQQYWLSPGAGQYVWRTGSFEYKAKRCRNLALDAISYAANNHEWSARQAWREIYGTAYPA
jgi:hypothetical protein